MLRNESPAIYMGPDKRGVPDGTEDHSPEFVRQFALLQSYNQVGHPPFSLLSILNKINVPFICIGRSTRACAKGLQTPSQPRAQVGWLIGGGLEEYLWLV